MDPLIVRTASLGFAALLFFAARHKLARPAAFRAVLAEYRVLPAPLVTPVAGIVPVAELLLAVAWLSTWTDSAPSRAVGVATAMLLGAYTIAVVVNLLRGRRYVSCGCGLSVDADESLSWGLVLRNAFLVVIAAVAARPAPARALGVFDYATLAAALTVAVLLYGAGAQLLRNAGAIGAWRRTGD